MNSDRATIRPVTLARLVETAALCETSPKTKADIEDLLNVSEQRAREVVSEVNRIGLIKRKVNDLEQYVVTNAGSRFLDAARKEEWRQIGNLLAEHSPHYSLIRDALLELESATQDELLERLNDQQSAYRFNETGVDVVCDWAERLGDLQRHAFSGRYYVVETEGRPDTEFHSVLLSEYEELNESVGLAVHQHYVSIPRLRECVCERLRCTRDAFDDALVSIVDRNIGKLELTGAPRDTTVKDGVLGIKRIETSEDEGIVTTIQSTDRVLRGIEYRNKQYYYFVDQRPDRPITPRELE